MEAQLVAMGIHFIKEKVLEDGICVTQASEATRHCDAEKISFDVHG